MLHRCSTREDAIQWERKKMSAVIISFGMCYILLAWSLSGVGIGVDILQLEPESELREIHRLRRSPGFCHKAVFFRTGAVLFSTAMPPGLHFETRY